MRRFRYSIASLLGLVLFAAVAVAALRQADDLWDSGMFTLSVGLLLTSVLLAIHRTGRRRDVNVPAVEAEIDLGGRAVLPGLVDAHGHLMYLARLRLTLDVAGLASEAACAEHVAARVASARPGEWIAGRGWDQNRWPGARFPSRTSLDRAAPEHPVTLVRVDGHALWVSSTALRIAGIGRHTPDPPRAPPSVTACCWSAAG